MDKEKLAAALLSSNSEIGEGHEVLIPCKIDLGGASIRVYVKSCAYTPDDALEKAVELMDEGWNIDTWQSSRNSGSPADRLRGNNYNRYNRRY